MSAAPAIGDDIDPRAVGAPAATAMFQLISLTENLMCIMLFDEDRFGEAFIFAVFVIEPLVAGLVSELAKLSKVRWYGISFQILSEIAQCLLYVYFSSCTPFARTSFASMLAVQLCLLGFISQHSASKVNSKTCREVSSGYLVSPEVVYQLLGAGAAMLPLAADESSPTLAPIHRYILRLLFTNSFEILQTTMLWSLDVGRNAVLAAFNRQPTDSRRLFDWAVFLLLKLNSAFQFIYFAASAAVSVVLLTEMVSLAVMAFWATGLLQFVWQTAWDWILKELTALALAVRAGLTFIVMKFIHFVVGAILLVPCLVTFFKLPVCNTPPQPGEAPPSSSLIASSGLNVSTSARRLDLYTTTSRLHPTDSAGQYNSDPLAWLRELPANLMRAIDSVRLGMNSSSSLIASSGLNVNTSARRLGSYSTTSRPDPLAWLRELPANVMSAIHGAIDSVWLGIHSMLMFLWEFPGKAVHFVLWLGSSLWQLIKGLALAIWHLPGQIWRALVRLFTFLYHLPGVVWHAVVKLPGIVWRSIVALWQWIVDLIVSAATFLWELPGLIWHALWVGISTVNTFIQVSVTGTCNVLYEVPCSILAFVFETREVLSLLAWCAVNIVFFVILVRMYSGVHDKASEVSPSGITDRGKDCLRVIMFACCIVLNAVLFMTSLASNQSTLADVRFMNPVTDMVCSGAELAFRNVTDVVVDIGILNGHAGSGDAVIDEDAGSGETELYYCGGASLHAKVAAATLAIGHAAVVFIWCLPLLIILRGSLQKRSTKSSPSATSRTLY